MNLLKEKDINITTLIYIINYNEYVIRSIGT